MKLHVSLLAGLSLAWLAGCGGSTTDADTGADAGAAQPDIDAGTTEDAEPADGGTEEAAPVDHGAPSDTYPAFPPDMPQLQNNGGAVLAHPVIVTVTWPNEPNADAFEQFAR